MALSRADRLPERRLENGLFSGSAILTLTRTDKSLKKGRASYCLCLRPSAQQLSNFSRQQTVNYFEPISSFYNHPFKGTVRIITSKMQEVCYHSKKSR